MRRTAKYNSALTAAMVAKIKSNDCEQAELYARLEAVGLAWNSKSGVWEDAKSTSVFAANVSGDEPTGAVKIRLMVHPAVLDDTVSRITKGLKTAGIVVAEVSEPYPNRRGAGVRVYIDGVLK